MLEIAGKTLIIYIVMLVMIRIMGKRTIGNLTALDMIVALVMGDLAGAAIYGQAPLEGAVVAIVSLSALHYANSWLAYSRPGIGAVLEGRPTVIVENGRFHRAGLRRERMSDEEARAELRLEGIEDLRDVKLAQVESDGRVSVLRKEPAEPAQKRDLTAG
jgi:uncharacterized membrane protein YcaP (DUF421 family)